MSQVCTVRNGILVDTTSSGLHTMRNTILVLIKKHLFPDAKQVNPPTSVSLKISTPLKTQYTSPPEELIFEIHPMDLVQHWGLIVPGLRGYYVAKEGKTYLVKGNWCLETLIHETLHACSRPSLEPELKRYDELFDGLTEFYTGYILFQAFKECYTNCFVPAGQLCEMTNHDYTKLWAALCHFISLRNTIRIFFPTEKLWDDEVVTFVQRIRDLGFTRFINPFGRTGLSSVTRFGMICDDTFGDNYNRISEQKNRYIDYNFVIDT